MNWCKLLLFHNPHIDFFLFWICIILYLFCICFWILLPLFVSLDGTAPINTLCCCLLVIDISPLSFIKLILIFSVLRARVCFCNLHFIVTEYFSLVCDFKSEPASPGWDDTKVRWRLYEFCPVFARRVWFLTSPKNQTEDSVEWDEEKVKPSK